MNDVCVVVVTYNRRLDLSKCLIALKEQTLKAFDVIIVDNNSNDETSEFLFESFNIDTRRCEESKTDNFYVNEGLFDEKQKLYVISKLINEGSAGGFATGLQYTLKFNYNWVWVMDDDGLPDRSCLETLLAYTTGNVAHCISPNLLTFDNKSHFQNVFDNSPLNHIQFDGGLWNGVLLNSQVLRTIGLPHKVFFIWGEETEYLDRMSEAGFVRITVKNALHYHKSTKFDYGQVPRVYYLVRNKVFMIRLHRGIYISRFVFTISQIVVITRLLFSSLVSLNFTSVRDIIRALFAGAFQDIK